MHTSAAPSRHRFRTHPLTGIVICVTVLWAASMPPARAQHDGDQGVMQTRWVRHGFAEGWALAAADLDGDGNEEVLYGGRKLAALDRSSGETGVPVWQTLWNHLPEANPLDGGDNTWATGIEIVQATGDDTPDALVTTSDTDAYLIDGATGAKVWHNPRTGSGFSREFALIDADADEIPDLYPAGSRHAISGATGEELWESPVPKGARFVASAELNGEPGRDVIVGITPPGVGTNPNTYVPALTAQTVYAVASDGTLLYSYSPVSGVESVLGADITGDGIDETIIGTFNGIVYAIGNDGIPLWATAAAAGAAGPAVAENIDLDPADEIIVGTAMNLGADASTVLAIDNTGVHLWRETAVGSVRALESMDADGDGDQELLVAAGTDARNSNVGRATLLDPQITSPLRELWSVDTHRAVTSATLVEGKEGNSVALGSGDTQLRVVDANTGEEQWRYAAGDYVRSLATGDLDGDGVTESAHVDDAGNVIVMDASGTQRWARRADISSDGNLLSVDFGDVNGDGRDEIAVTGWRYGSADPGVAELYGPAGDLLWSRLLPGNGEKVAIADLDGDGTKEVVVAESLGLDGSCTIAALASDDGTDVWRTEVSRCLIPTFDVGDVDADGDVEVAYGDRTLFAQPHVALLEHDGSIRWNQGIREQVFWINAVADGVLHGGYGESARGSITRRNAAGDVTWSTLFADDPDFGSGSRFGTLIPDRTGDGTFEIAASADDGTVHLVDGLTGAELWVQRLEPIETDFLWRHQNGPLVYVPAQGSTPQTLIAAQHSIGRARAKAFALGLDGTILGSIEMEGEAYGAGLMRFADGTLGAAIGAGLGAYGVTACGTCDGPDTGTPIATSLTLTFQKVQGDVVAVARLLDADGAAISDRTITFTLNGTPAGEAITASDGTARLPLHRNVAKQGDAVTATFAGDATYAGASTTASIPRGSS